MMNQKDKLQGLLMDTGKVLESISERLKGIDESLNVVAICEAEKIKLVPEVAEKIKEYEAAVQADSVAHEKLMEAAKSGNTEAHQEALSNRTETSETLRKLAKINPNIERLARFGKG
jgi:Xaa-Pro aminopeptidase